MPGAASQLDLLLSQHGPRILNDIVCWDIATWKKAIYFWESRLPPDLSGRVLEVGSNRGGLSLYFALRGLDVVCSDIENPEPYATALHEAYDVRDRIDYAKADALDLPFEESEFDLVCYKSVLGGIGRDGRYDLQKRAITEIHRVLRPGGYLLFAENLIASPLHRFVRRHFVRWGSSWRYLSLLELHELLGIFSTHELRTFGFVSAFGRSERLRRILAGMDGLFLSLIPETARYVATGIAKK